MIALMRKFFVGFIVLITIILVAGVPLAKMSSSAPSFHDIRINTTQSYIDLIEPSDPEIIELSKQFTTIEDAYLFVAKEIRFAPFVPSGPVRETLRHGMGSCIGKAVLLCSIYRAMGVPAEDVRIVVGIVVTENGLADHVWIDMEHDGKCLQQDPSGMLGQFGFYEFPGNGYVDKYVMKEIFCFNDSKLAIVSQLNRMRH